MRLEPIIAMLFAAILQQIVWPQENALCATACSFFLRGLYRYPGIIEYKRLYLGSWDDAASTERLNELGIKRYNPAGAVYVQWLETGEAVRCQTVVGELKSMMP